MTHITIGIHNTFRGRAEFEPIADVIGWQEVNTARAVRRLKRSLPDYEHFVPRGQGCSVPISYDPKKVHLLRAWAIETHGSGRSMGLHLFGRARYIVVAVLRPKGMEGKPLVFINTHMVNAAWGGWKPTRALRRRLWTLHQTMLTAVVQKLRERDYEVVVGGDLNRHAWDVIPGLVDARYSAARTPGYDRLMSVPSKRLRLVSVRKGALDGSDHRAMVARFDIE